MGFVVMWQVASGADLSAAFRVCDHQLGAARAATAQPTHGASPAGPRPRPALAPRPPAAIPGVPGFTARITSPSHVQTGALDADALLAGHSNGSSRGQAV